MGHMFLLLVDAHTKWMDIHIVSSATSQSTIEKMRNTFATLGLPEMLVTVVAESDILEIWETS